MPTTVTQATSSRVTTHHITLQGISGYMFLLLIVGTVMFVVAFASTGWTVHGNSHAGLWEGCTCWKISHKHSWHAAAQAMFTISLIGLLLGCIASCIYMCVHTFNKNTVIIAITILCFVSFIFLLIGLIIYGSNVRQYLNWSFAFATISAIMCLVAGILAFLQMRRAGV